MTYKIRHRLIRWLARGDTVNLNPKRPTFWMNGSPTSAYRFDGVEWFRV